MDVEERVNPKNFDKQTKSLANNKFHDESKFRKNERKIVLNSHKSRHLCGVNTMTMKDLCETLARVEENPVEPFTFLTKISESFHSLYAPTTEITTPNLTGIDIQLATLSRRIQLNKTLLEQTNNRVRKFNSSIERQVKNKIEDGSDSSVSAGEHHTSIDEMQQTLRLTIETLNNMGDLMNNESGIA